MEFLFHIGMAKTGSSSIQNALWAEAAYLRQRNVLYPIDPAAPSRENHRLFALAMRSMDRLPRHMQIFKIPEQGAELLESFHAHVLATIRETSPELLLMSSETLFHGIDRNKAPAFREMMSSFGAEPVFVAYLRRPSDWYLSVLQQHLRSSARIGVPRPPKMRRVISDFEDVFGPEALRLHLFDRSALAGGDVLADFIQRYLAAYGIVPDQFAGASMRNPGISAESMILLQRFCRDMTKDPANVPKGATRRFLHALRQADGDLGLPKARLTNAVSEAIDYSSRSPLWLRDRFGIVFPEFDYARLEAGNLTPSPSEVRPLEEILQVDPEALAALIDHIRQSDWAAWRVLHLLTANRNRWRRKAWLDRQARRGASERR
ncbi:MAG: hypothetical protein AAGH83_05025 [Pseudomonadota bacterium]